MVFSFAIKTDLFLQSAVEDEDEHALEGVEGGEEVCHNDSVLIDEQQTKGPRQTQKEEQSDSS